MISREKALQLIEEKGITEEQFKRNLVDYKHDDSKQKRITVTHDVSGGTNENLKGEG